MLEQFNRIALEAALRHMLGEDGMREGHELYRVLDVATTQAYQLAALETMQAMQPVVEEAIEAGRVAGKRDGHEAGWRDGYVMGVARARLQPDVADAVVAHIIDTDPVQEEADTQLFLEGSARAVSEQDDTMPLPEFYQGDSGDECSRCVICGLPYNGSPLICDRCAGL